jgi:hypothetical protein
MSNRGRRAALPEDGHERTPVLMDTELLVVRHVEENGERWDTYSFGGLPVAPALQRSLAELFARRVGPDGIWKVLNSSKEGWNYLRTFTRWLSGLDDPPRDIPEITPAVWAQWRISRPSNTVGRRQIQKVAAFLRDHPRLPAATRELMARRVGRDEVKEVAYSPQEFDRIKTIATRVFRSALYRIQENQRRLEDWRAGRVADGTQEWFVGEALDHISRTGDVPTYIGWDRVPGGDRLRRVRVRQTTQNLLGGDGNTWQRLFLTSAEAAALTVLLVATYGWNAVPVSELRVPTSAPNPGLDGQVIYRVELEKRRRHHPHRYETRNLTDWGADSPGRLITQAIEATAPARATLAALGKPADRLIVYRVDVHLDPERPNDLFGFGMRENAARPWRSQLGEGFRLNLRRLRKTVIVADKRTPTQHTQDTHDQVYVLPDPQTRQRAEEVISNGVAAALEHARTTFAARISKADTDSAQDTATASCTDYTHSPFGEHGSPCRASFLLCTGCPNAVVTPRHLPRLAYLMQALDELRGVVPAAVWEQDWREHHARLLDLRSRPDFTDAEWRDALAVVSAQDKDAIDQLLRRGFDS